MCCCTKALLTGRTAAGRWVDRTAQFRALERGDGAGERAFTAEEELTLAPLPCWRHLDPAERRRKVAAMVRDIEL